MYFASILLFIIVLKVEDGKNDLFSYPSTQNEFIY